MDTSEKKGQEETNAMVESAENTVKEESDISADIVFLEVSLFKNFE